MLSLLKHAPQIGKRHIVDVERAAAAGVGAKALRSVAAVLPELRSAIARAHAVSRRKIARRNTPRARRVHMGLRGLPKRPAAVQMDREGGMGRGAATSCGVHGPPEIVPIDTQVRVRPRFGHAPHHPPPGASSPSSPRQLGPRSPCARLMRARGRARTTATDPQQRVAHRLSILGTDAIAFVPSESVGLGPPGPAPQAMGLPCGAAPAEVRSTKHGPQRPASPLDLI